MGVLDAVLDLLGGLGQQVVELGVEDRHAGMVLEEGDPILAVLDDRAVDLQRQLAAAHRDHLGRLVGLRQERRHADLGDRGDRAEGGLDRQLEVVLEQPAQLTGHLEPQGIDPDVGDLALAQVRLHLRLEECPAAAAGP